MIQDEVEAQTYEDANQGDEEGPDLGDNDFDGPSPRVPAGGFSEQNVTPAGVVADADFWADNNKPAATSSVLDAITKNSG